MVSRNAQKIRNLASRAAIEMDAQKYSEMMDTLISLGELMEEGLPEGKLNFRQKAEHVRATLLANVSQEFDVPLHNHAAFLAFESALNDAGLKKRVNATVDGREVEVSERSLALKANLNMSTRRKLTLGLMALRLLVKEQALRKEMMEKNEASLYSEKAAEAIRSYLTTRQKVLAAIANFFTFGAAITFGLTTFAAFLLLPVTWPVVAVFGLASVVGIAGAIVNWNIFKKPVFNFLNDIMGKDKPFEGFTRYIKDDGKKGELSVGKKIAVAVSGFLSLSVGAALGALTYASVLGLSQVSFLGFLAVGVGASFLPPVAIGLGIVAFVCLTALMLNAFSGMLKTDKISSIFTAPFKAVNDVFKQDNDHPQNRGKRSARLAVEKGITFAITGALTVLGLFGLGMFSWACAGALSQMLSTTLGVVPFIATAVGYAVGMGAALVGQVPFILSAVGQSVANIASKFCDLFSPNKEFAASREGATFKEKLGSAWDGVLVVINAIGNGALVVPSMIASGFSMAFSAVSAAASFYNSFSAGASSFKAPGVAEQKQANALKERMNLLLRPSNAVNAEPVRENDGVNAPLLAGKEEVRAFRFADLGFFRQGPNGGARAPAAAAVPNLDDQAAGLNL